MRADSVRLATAVAEIDEADRVARAQQLCRWFDGFAGQIEAHHAVEDQLFFPLLAERAAVFEYEVGRIEAEHAHLDAAIDRTRRAIEALGDPSVRWADASRRAIGITVELHDLLDRHLTFESEYVLPMFIRHFDAADYETLDVMATRSVSHGQLPFTIPWAMANAEPAERELLLEGAPVMFKLMWWATRGRYRRMVEDAFGHESNGANARVKGHANGTAHTSANGNGNGNLNGHTVPRVIGHASGLGVNGAAPQGWPVDS
jgi:hemerythrin-like domain-containing protein